MSSKHATAEAVAMLFTAAGRNYADVELRLYHDAWFDVTDDELLHVARRLVREVDLSRQFPSPAYVRGEVLHLRRSRAAASPQPALEAQTDYLPVEESRRLIREAVARLREASKVAE